MTISCKKCGEYYCPVCKNKCPKCGEIDIVDKKTMENREKMRWHMNRNKIIQEIKELKIIEKIYKRRDEIISRIEPESIGVYLWLKNEYNKGDVKKNLVFQFVFRSYYGLDSAGLSDKQKKRFFELMADKKVTLEKILEELYKLPTLKNKQAIQFSFATKLLHTINNNKPIFDAKVSAVIHKNRGGNDEKSKIESCREIYNFLENLYLILVEEEKIRKIISKFRLKFHVAQNQMTDSKILDFIIWSLGKMESK